MVLYDDKHKEHIESCVHKLKPTGKVIQIGFGLGYSARAICSLPHVTECNVIECSPRIWNDIDNYSNNKLKLIKGRWEDVMHIVGNVDCVFVDNSNYIKNQWVRFLHECHNNNLTIGGKVGIYSGSEFFGTMQGFKEDSTHMPLKIYTVIDQWKPLVTKKNKTGKLLSNISLTAHIQTENKNLIKIFENITYKDISVLSGRKGIKAVIDDDFKILNKVGIYFYENCEITINDKYIFKISPYTLIILKPCTFILNIPDKVTVFLFIL